MKKYVWLAIVGVGVLCIAIFYYVFVYRLTCDLNGWTLTISGKEKMPDYSYFNDKIAPWNYKHPHIKDFFTAEVHNVIIKEGVTRIGNYAFKNCPYLEHVTIPSSVTEIGDSAFYDCINLNSVDITDLEAWCKIDFGNYYANPLSQALHFCLSGKEVNDLVIPDGVTKIGDYAFAGYSGITSVTIPSSVEKIGYGAFKGCSGLTSITIPSSVKYIGDYAFAGCFGLTSITIPSSVKEIRTCAFVGCTGLTSVHITDLLSWCRIDFDTFFSDSYSDEYRGEYANPLYNAKHLYLNGKEIHDLVIPNGTTEIKRHAFEGCSGLKSVTIPASVKKIGHGAFSGCSSLKSITIPKSVKVIRTGAFAGCTSLTSVTIPSSVKEIGEYAFGWCDSLKSVHITDIESWCKIDFGNEKSNPLYYAEHLYLNGKEIDDLVIPNGVTKIGNYAFYFCSGLKSVTIPSSVKEIGYGTFSSCSGLRSIECWAKNPPLFYDDSYYDSFHGVEESIPVYVPTISIDKYKYNSNWYKFNIRAIK